MDMKITLAERLKTARTVLLGRGDDALVCSFCGKNRHEVGYLVRGPGANICSWCTSIAHLFIVNAELTPAPDKAIETFLVIEEPAKLLPVFQASLGPVLSQCAHELHCKLMTWSYSDGGEVMSDSLSVTVEIDRGTNLSVFRETFNRMTLIGPLDR